MGDSLESLKKLVSRNDGLELVTEEAVRAELSHDTWMRSLLQRRAGYVPEIARAVVRPSTTADVSALLEWAEASQTAVVPYGLGSGVCGGVLAGADTVVIDMRNMAAMVEINEETLNVRVQPGMCGADFERELNSRGLSMGHFPQSIGVSSVGGWCATRASGQFSTRYGNIEDMMVGCEVVLAGGKVVRMPASPRSSTGPDLKELFMGSEGTLGIFTELTFRVHELAEESAGCCYTLDSVAAGIEAMRLVMRAGWRPAAMRLYDATEAGRHFSMDGAEGQPALLIVSEGPAALVESEVRAVGEIVEKAGGRSRGSGPVESWLEHRNEVPSFDELVDRGLVVDTIEVAVGWDRLAGLFETAIARGAAIEGVMVMSGHLSHCYGDGANIYFTFVGTCSEADDATALYDRVWEATMEATLEAGGTIAHHHGIGRVRKDWLRRELGPAHEVLRALKRTLDPSGIMNPGVLMDMD